MKNVIIASNDNESINSIKSCLQSNYKINTASSIKNSLDIFATQKFDFLFIEFTFFKASDSKESYKSQLKSFWQIFPDTEIIILTSQQSIREAVEIVKPAYSLLEQEDVDKFTAGLGLGSIQLVRAPPQCAHRASHRPAPRTVRLLEGLGHLQIEHVPPRWRQQGALVRKLSGLRSI